MSVPYVGEIRMFAGNFAPAGWEFCNGQLLSIAENEVLFQLIGTTYGGDGIATFALPDLRSRIPLHQGEGPGLSNRLLAEQGGTEQVMLQTNEIPSHSHPLRCRSASATQKGPGNASWGSASTNLYQTGAANTTMNPDNVGPNNGGQPHDNRMPFLAVSYIISMFGIFPSPS